MPVLPFASGDGTAGGLTQREIVCGEACFHDFLSHDHTPVTRRRMLGLLGTCRQIKYMSVRVWAVEEEQCDGIFDDAFMHPR